MSDIFKDLEEVFELGFGRPRAVFRSVLKDQMPACWHKTQTGYKALVKTLGIDSVDVKLDEDTYEIIVSGSNKIDDQDFSTTVTLPIIQDVVNNVMEIKHSTLCGITIIELIIDRPEKRKIKITRLNK